MVGFELLVDRWIIEDEPTHGERTALLAFLIDLSEDPTIDGSAPDPFNSAIRSADVPNTRASIAWRVSEDQGGECVIQGLLLENL